jgi:hypothetical protein
MKTSMVAANWLLQHHDWCAITTLHVVKIFKMYSTKNACIPNEKSASQNVIIPAAGKKQNGFHKGIQACAIIDMKKGKVGKTINVR